MLPLCFILMPFGRKPAGDGRMVDFDAIYETLIKPAVVSADLEPLRADEEIVGGVIHKAMFERLILCEFAVADLTTANANVFYELGLRHAVRPWATQLIFAESWGQLPFDVNLLRALPYQLAADGRPTDVVTQCGVLTKKLKAAQDGSHDSPVFQMVEGFPDVQRLKTDVFRERVRYAENMKVKLAAARKAGASAVSLIERELGEVSQVDAAVVIDLFLSYRAVQSWQSMVDLVGRMARPLAATVMVREQLGLALNRAGDAEQAEHVLLELISQRGPSSETYGILGRVYKDQWQKAFESGNSLLAQGLLEKAIRAYLRGFETDWRDPYPGVNAVTLMEVSETVDPRQAALIPVVHYAAERGMAHRQPDYWDFATRLELAVLTRDRGVATRALADALANMREPWELETTIRNLRLVCEARASRGENVDWIATLLASMKK